MNPFNKIALLSLGIFILAGCELYTSHYPITDYKESFIDTSLVGNWKNCDSDTIEYAIRIDKLDTHQYLLNYLNINDLTHINQHENFIAHNSIVLGKEYFNIRMLNNDSIKYFFLKKEFKEDTLLISTIDKDAFDRKFESSKNFKTYILENGAAFDSVFDATHRFVQFEPEYK